ncbi:MAG: hypothetical protein L3J71_07265 [Victivallaceae bacterium]|nr:hypothetical protein [Victivallaceae bacterium]
MKILYIEDELMKHVNKIDELFGSVLTKKITRQLKKLLLDEDTDSTDIKNLMNGSNVVDVAITFPAALDKVINHRDDYALFIVDRNLSGDDICEYEDIVAVHPEFTKSHYDRFCEREGDYLLEYLINKQVDCGRRFYMLTGNSDRLRNEDFLKDKIHFSNFKADNIIAKGSENILIKIIQDVGEIMLRLEHPEIYLLSDHQEIRQCHQEQLTNILAELKRQPTMNREKIRGNLAKLRTVVVELLDDINKIDELCYYSLAGQKASERNKINWLEGNQKTAFIKPYCDYIYTIASETSTHSFDDDNFPTIHTLNSAISATKDIFKWLSIELEKIKHCDNK